MSSHLELERHLLIDIYGNKIDQLAAGNMTKVRDI